jgi:hypothetical protein
LKSKAKPEPKPQPTKTSKPRIKSFTMIENGETIGISMIVTEPVRINGIMV